MEELRKYAPGVSLPSDGEYYCKSITAFKAKLVGVTLTSVTKDSAEIYALMMPSDQRYLQFVDQRVMVSFRTEIIEGCSVLYINNFTRIEEVALVPSKEIFRLYLDKPVQLGTNTVFQDLVENKEYKNQKLYCIRNSYRASTKSYWSEYRLMDRDRRVIIGRCFHPISDAPDHTGRYIQADIIRTKFGLNMDNIKPLTESITAVNPLVKIAKNYIEKQVGEFSSATQRCLETTALLSFLENNIPDEDYEIGFDLVHIAIGLSLVEPYVNLSKNLNVRVIKEAMVLQYLHLLKYEPKFSKSINTMLALARYNNLGDKLLVSLLTDEPEEGSLERTLFLQTNDLIKTAIRATVNEIK